MKTFQKASKVAALIFLGSHLLSCGQKGGSSNASQTVVKKQSVGNIGSENASVASPAFVSKEAPGAVFQFNSRAPAPLLLQPEALKQVYSPVFGINPRKLSTQPGFVNNTAFQASNFFNHDESLNLGKYLIQETTVSSSPRVIPFSMKWVRQIDPDYIISLRAFAGDACKNLVNSELPNPSNAANKLVKGANLETAHVSSFLSELLGYSPASGTHDGSEEYKKAFQFAMQVDPKPSNAAETKTRQSLAYQHLCIALATDVRVFTR
jgi:hypothetical protein